MLGALASLLLVAAAERPFAEERQLLDRRLETLRRILPDGPNPGSDVALVSELARGARLMGLEILPRAPVENGARGDVPLEVSAVGSYAEIDRFFRLVALSPRLVDVDHLTLAAVPDGPVKMTALLRVPFRPPGAPLPAPPEGFRPRDPTVPRPQADGYARDQMLSVAKSEAIAALRRSRRNPRLFLSEIAAAVREWPVILSHASLAEEFAVRGVVVGEASLRGLESRLERGFFRVTDFLITRRGACYRFEVRGRSPVVGVDAEIPLPAEDPFQPEDAQCRPDRDGGPVAVVRAPSAKTPGKGPLTLRAARGGHGGRVQRAARPDRRGVHRGRRRHRPHEPGPRPREPRRGADRAPEGRVEHRLRIRAAPGLPLRLQRPPRAPLSVDATAPIRLSAKRAEVKDVLAAMAEAEPTLASEAPAGSLGRLSIWGRDINVAGLRAAVLEAAGLAERAVDGRRIVERARHDRRGDCPHRERAAAAGARAGRGGGIGVRAGGPGLRAGRMGGLRVLPAGRAPGVPGGRHASPTAWCAPSSRPTSSWPRRRATCASSCPPSRADGARGKKKAREVSPGPHGFLWADCPAHRAVRAFLS